MVAVLDTYTAPWQHICGSMVPVPPKIFGKMKNRKERVKGNMYIYTYKRCICSIFIIISNNFYSFSFSFILEVSQNLSTLGLSQLVTCIDGKLGGTELSWNEIMSLFLLRINYVFASIPFMTKILNCSSSLDHCQLDFCI